VRAGLAHEAPGVLVFDRPSPVDSPFCRVMLNFIDAPPITGAREPSGGSLEPVALSLTRDRKSALAWVVGRGPTGRLNGSLMGGSDWFEAATISAWARRLLSLLERGVRHPTLRLSALLSR
jgi:hypothetical protein